MEKLESPTDGSWDKAWPVGCGLRVIWEKDGRLGLYNNGGEALEAPAVAETNSAHRSPAKDMKVLASTSAA